jgi:hypothetical protein
VNRGERKMLKNNTGGRNEEDSFRDVNFSIAMAQQAILHL